MIHVLEMHFGILMIHVLEARFGILMIHIFGNYNKSE